MDIIDLETAAQLKSLVKETFSVQLHFHDGCGGQYFSMEKPAGRRLRDWVVTFGEERRLKVIFSEDGCGFYFTL